MNNCIITQSKDQSWRLKDWILYHHSQGFDTFIFFDDASVDDTVDNLKRISEKFDINIIIKNSDGLGGKKGFEEMQNSNSYAGDQNINNRILRSYNSGLELVKSINPNALCAFIDCDEFIVSNSDHLLIEVIKNLMNQRNMNQLYINSFDVKDDFEKKEWYTTQHKTKFRWDYDFRSTSYWMTRGKSVLFASEIDYIPEGSGYVHVLTDKMGGTYFDNANVGDYDQLRIHHFRKPAHDPDFLFVEDDVLFDKMIKIKELYEGI
jgi:hypothetical protein